MYKVDRQTMFQEAWKTLPDPWLAILSPCRLTISLVDRSEGTAIVEAPLTLTCSTCSAKAPHGECFAQQTRHGLSPEKAAR